MNVQHAPTETRKRSFPLDTQVPGRWLTLARGLWLTLAAITLTIFGASLPMYMAQLQTACAGSTCQWQQLTPEQGKTLTEIGLSLADYAAFTVALTIVSTIVCLLVSTLIVWRRSDDWMALTVALMLLTLGPIIETTAMLEISSPWQIPNECLTLLFLLLFLLVFLLFPSGQFVPGWTRWLFIVFLVGQIPLTFLPIPPLIPNIQVSQPAWLVSLGELALVAGVQVQRYRRVSSPRECQQTKWVIFGLAVPIAANVIVTVLYLLSPVLAEPASLYPLAYNEVGFLLPFFLPLTFGFAILRFRLWDIDNIINRTLVYGLLTMSIVSVYVLVVSSLGTLLPSSGGFLPSLLATSLVAILFHPLHARLQRIVNRLMYGERDEPYAVLTRLGHRLEATLAPDSVLPTLVETIAQALKLPYAAIALKQREEFITTASSGSLQDDLLVLPLVYRSQTVGQLLLAPRAQGETFTTADHRLLEAIASQAGVAAHAVHLTADLQHSRERLVTAREEERRRLRRDLHDGLGATLAALHLQAGAVRTLMRQDLGAADAELLDFQAEIRSAIADIRRLVYALRPPTLDELGLVGAIRQHVAQYDLKGASNGSEEYLSVAVEAPEHMPTLPAAVEVAAYRIVQEALTNVARHARARTCTVCLAITDVFELSISDDGVGFSASSCTGVGLLSMRERAAEPGGSCLIESAPGIGTRIVVHLPLPKEES